MHNKLLFQIIFIGVFLYLMNFIALSQELSITISNESDDVQVMYPKFAFCMSLQELGDEFDTVFCESESTNNNVIEQGEQQQFHITSPQSGVYDVVRIRFIYQYPGQTGDFIQCLPLDKVASYIILVTSVGHQVSIMGFDEQHNMPTLRDEDYFNKRGRQENYKKIFKGLPPSRGSGLLNRNGRIYHRMFPLES